MPNLSLHFEKTIAHLVFSDAPDSEKFLGATILTELSEKLDELSCHAVDGLVISLKIHGTDLSEIASSNNEQLSQNIAAGQTISNRISDLPFPTAAAIHGPCIGGGYELALACDWRIATEQPETQIGLPEISQGIIPAHGGNSRLPELLGLAESIPIILSSEIYPVAAAKEKGLIDEISHPEDLIKTTLTFIEKGKRNLTHNPMVHNQAIAALTRKQFLKELQKRGQESSPAAEAALEIAVASIGKTRTQSQHAELAAITSLSASPETKNLLHFSILKRKATTEENPPTAQEIQHTAILGATPTGCHIAHLSSLASLQTILYDPDINALAKGMKILSSFTGNKTISSHTAARALDLIHPTNTSFSPARTEFLIEAAPLNLPAQLSPKTILATHSTAAPISRRTHFLPHPERHLGLHFPTFVPDSEVVEIIRTDTTSAQTIHTTQALLRRLGKIPIIVRDSPGFVISRLMTAYLTAASDLFKNGADPDEIDHAMLSFGMKIGPLHLIDKIGLQTVLDHAKLLHQAFPQRLQIPETLSQLLKTEHRGRENNSGFFVYDSLYEAVNAEAIEFQDSTGETQENIAEILSSIILQEAELCLQEGIVSSREELELLMILGIGYPPFRNTRLSHH